MKLHNLLTYLGAILLIVAVISSVNKWNWLLSLGALMAGLLCWLASEILLLRKGAHYLQSKQVEKLPLKRGGAWFGE
jgi:hypothetical protein